jgi:hypothetical protein
MESLNGHEAGNGGYGQGRTYGNSPFLDPTQKWLRRRSIRFSLKRTESKVKDKDLIPPISPPKELISPKGGNK